MNISPLHPTVLVTGGAGYIGSHTCIELLRAGYDVVVVDDFSTGSLVALDRVESVTGAFVRSYHVDIRDEVALGHVFEREDIAAVIHFAAKKAVGESTEIPIEYFDDNVGGTATLLKVMEAHGVQRLVFSSSCSIYGNTSKPLLDELSAPAPANPYAWTKLACEEMVAQACHYNPDLRATALRYFNPIGAHPSGLLGEDPTGIPRNVMPYLTQVAMGTREFLPVFGDDYPTPDGSAVRDYIHVLDVARGHLDALAHLDDEAEMQLFNLGTGVGTSVLDLCTTLARVSGREIPLQVQPRRDGDVPRLVADTSKVGRAWGWTTHFTLTDMCRDAWNFQQHNPGGYSSAWKAAGDARPSGHRAA